MGDDKYQGVTDTFDAIGVSTRLHLHAYRVLFTHPKTGQIMDVKAPLPQDLKKSWSAFGFDANIHDDPFESVRT